MRICSIGTMGIPHVRHESGLSQKGSHKEGGGGGAFLPNFQECLFLT